MVDVSKRFVRIKNKNDDPAETDAKATLVIKEVLPVLTMTDLMENKIANDVTEFTNPQGGTTEPTNEYYDPNTDSRFQFIYDCVSIYRNIPFCLYYDNLLNDFILLPNPDNYDLDFIKNKNFEIEAYQYGVEKPLSNTLVDSEVTKKDFPKGKKVDSITSELLLLYGVVNSTPTRIRANVDSNTSIYKNINPYQAVKVKKSDIMDSGKIPVHNVTYRNFNHTDVIYSFRKDPEYIWLPIPF